MIDSNDTIVYVGYTKDPYYREKGHYHKGPLKGRTDVRMVTQGSYNTSYEARYNEEKIKRNLGMRGEMGDKLYHKYEVRYE